jgi:membrane-bound lytic murein transglycosylase B
MKKVLKTGFLATFIVLFLIPSRPVIPEDTSKIDICKKKYACIDSLVLKLKGKGHDIESFLSNPKFEIYENIDSIFINSAEAVGADAYKEALKKGDTAEAEKIFDEEYEKYKKKIGFDDKKNYMTQFMKQFPQELPAAEKQYVIPDEIIASIIGIESNFGRYSGKRQAFNVFISLYVKNYRRDFALRQLEELLNFRQRNNQDMFDFNSSYAGAIGFMQFIPSSLNQWFVGKDVKDMNDTINSVANYLAHFKEKEGALDKAVYRYNPSKFYVKAVFELADYGKETTGTQEGTK